MRRYEGQHTIATDLDQVLLQLLYLHHMLPVGSGSAARAIVTEVQKMVLLKPGR